MKRALIVVDVQKSFTKRDYWSEDELPTFKKNLSTLIEKAKAARSPVVHIFHTDNESNSPFSIESGLVKLLDGIPEYKDISFYKSVHNSFTDTGLDRWLRRQRVSELMITGIRTEQCCETTTRVASDLGYAVNFATDATLTFPMKHPTSGRVYSPVEIKEKTELVLSGRFARIVSSDNFSFN